MNMESETIVSLFTNFSNMLGEIYGRMEKAETKVKELESKTPKK